MAKKEQKQRSKIAPGEDSFLKKDASKNDIKKGNYTKVTILSFDEVDPSK